MPFLNMYEADTGGNNMGGYTAAYDPGSSRLFWLFNIFNHNKCEFTCRINNSK